MEDKILSQTINLTRLILQFKTLLSHQIGQKFKYMMISKPASTNQGLAGIVAGESGISTVGLGIGLNYRGYNAVDLARYCIFEEVIHLLLFGSLPTKEQLASLKARLAAQRTLPPTLIKFLENIPREANCIDVMRTTISVMGILEPQTKQNDQYAIAIRLIGINGPALLYWYHFSHHGRRIKTETLPTDTMAENFLKLYHQIDQLDPVIAKIFDGSFTLSAEHQFNASTFTARVIVSTQSDFYSAVTGAIGAARGPLHGGASGAVMSYLETFSSIEDSNKYLEAKWHQKKLVMGFGHRVYKKEDPRSNILKEYSQQLVSRKWGSPQLMEIAKNTEEKMINERKIYPNADFYGATVMFQCGINLKFYTPLFMMGRTAGWSAHIIQQRKSKKIIRPMSKYTGPEPTSFVPMDLRPML